MLDAVNNLGLSKASSDQRKVYLNTSLISYLLHSFRSMYYDIRKSGTHLINYYFDFRLH